MTEYSYVLKILFVTRTVFKFAHKEQAKLSLISTAFVKKNCRSTKVKLYVPLRLISKAFLLAGFEITTMTTCGFDASILNRMTFNGCSFIYKLFP